MAFCHISFQGTVTVGTWQDSALLVTKFFSSPSLMCIIHRNSQSPFVCGEPDPGQLEGPRLALSSKLTERGTSTDESGARKNRRSRRKNNLPPKCSSLVEDPYHIGRSLQGHNGTFIILCVWRQKIFLFSLILSLFKITWRWKPVLRE